MSTAATAQCRDGPVPPRPSAASTRRYCATDPSARPCAHAAAEGEREWHGGVARHAGQDGDRPYLHLRRMRRLRVLQLGVQLRIRPLELRSLPRPSRLKKAARRSMQGRRAGQACGLGDAPLRAMPSARPRTAPASCGGIRSVSPDAQCRFCTAVMFRFCVAVSRDARSHGEEQCRVRSARSPRASVAACGV